MDTHITKRKQTTITLPPTLIEEAKDNNINISATAEKALQDQLREIKIRQWKEENREAIESSNAYVEKHGLPYKPFWMQDE